MPDPIEHYLDQVMAHASLAGPDARKVRAELRDHLQTLLDGTHTYSEAIAMLEKEFGNPKEIGGQIAGSKGRIRTWLKKKLRRAGIAVPVALVLAFLVRATIAQAFYAAGHSVEPMVPHGSRVLVNKLATTFQDGDVIVYRVSDGGARLGIHRSQNPAGEFVVSRNNEPDFVVARDKVVGRVFLNTR